TRTEYEQVLPTRVAMLRQRPGACQRIGRIRFRGPYLSGLGAAFGLSRRCHDGAPLVLADQSLRQEVICHVCDSGHVLAMIFPNATRSGTDTRRELVNAAPVRVDDSTLRGIRT